MGKMRRKRLLPDTRPKWNDPDLTCYFAWDEIPAEIKHKLSIQIMEQEFVSNYPHWTDDPSYNWRRKK